MPFPRAEKLAVYRDALSGHLLKRLTDQEGKRRPDAVRYETGAKDSKGETIVAWFVPLEPAPKPPTKAA